MNEYGNSNSTPLIGWIEALRVQRLFPRSIEMMVFGWLLLVKVGENMHDSVQRYFLAGAPPVHLLLGLKHEATMVPATKIPAYAKYSIVH